MRREADADPAESTRAVPTGAIVTSLHRELRPRDLPDHAFDALADLGRGAVDLGRVAGEDDPGGAEVVEALGVADVLEADREARAPLHALAPGRVPCSARQPDRVARQLLGRRHLEGGGAANDLCHRQRAADDLAGRQRVAGRECVQQP